MKILHTSDWHLGHVLYNYERTEEQKSMLEQIIKIVEEKRPDLFLLCGDVYHTSQPSSAVQTMFTEAIMKIHEIKPDMKIVITAGNHDSAIKHEIFRKPWQALNVHAIGSLNKINVEEHIIEIGDKGFVIAVPYSNERNIPEGFFQDLIVETQKRNENNKPITLSAHTTVAGCDFSGHERADEYIVGGIESVDLKTIGDGYDYLALGHIHREQFVDKQTQRVRYCGTPLAINFDEKFSHSVSFVEIESHGDKPKVETIEIKTEYPLVTLPTEGFASWEEVKELLRKFPDEHTAYIRLNVEIEDYLPAEVNSDIIAITKDKKCKFCYINTQRKNTTKENLHTLTIGEFQSEEPIGIAEKYAKYMGVDFDEDMQSSFKEVLEIIEKESRED